MKKKVIKHKLRSTLKINPVQIEELNRILHKRVAIIGDGDNKYGMLIRGIRSNGEFVIYSNISDINNLDGWLLNFGFGQFREGSTVGRGISKHYYAYYFFKPQDIKKIDGLRIYLNPKVRKNPCKNKLMKKLNRKFQNPKPDLNDYEYKSKWSTANLAWFCKKCGYRQEGYSEFGPTRISHHPDCPVGQREGKGAGFRKNPELPTNKENLFKLGWLIGLKETYENPRYLSRILSVEELEQIIREFRDDGFNLAITTGSKIVNHIDTRDAFDFGKRYGKKKALINILDKETPIKQRIEDVSGLLRAYDNHKTLPTLHVLELVF